MVMYGYAALFRAMSSYVGRCRAMQVFVISLMTETLQDHLNLTKPHQILPEATTASPTAPNLRYFKFHLQPT